MKTHSSANHVCKFYKITAILFYSFIFVEYNYKKLKFSVLWKTRHNFKKNMFTVPTVISFAFPKHFRYHMIFNWSGAHLKRQNNKVMRKFCSDYDKNLWIYLPKQTNKYFNCWLLFCFISDLPLLLCLMVLSTTEYYVWCN